MKVLISNNLKWYWNRLQAMSLSETISRSQISVNKAIWSYRNSWIPQKPNLTLKKDTWTILSLESIATEESKTLLDEANCYLQGKYNLLNISFEETNIDWHLDPQNAKSAPLKFGPTLNYRDFFLVGNVKNIWEKNRHHHLTVLALAYALTNDNNYAEVVERQLLSWIEQNPFPLGINWTSSLELGVRLISWIWLERLLRGTSSHQRLFGKAGKLWSAIYWHQWLISQYYSPGSSANNHLVGEMAGLFIAAVVWPVFPESARWQSLARSILEREVSRQTFPSGLNREQAFSYHIFSLEFFLLAGLEAERMGIPFSSTYRDWVRRMLEVIPSVMDMGGNLPNYGDSDEGMALQLRSQNSSRLDWLFRLGRQWLKARVSLPKDSSGLLAATLIGTDNKDEVGKITTHKESIGFKDAGLFAIASNRGQPDEVFCLADAGPLGFLSIAAHGHADALSFTLSIGGVPVIIDTGTYSYHADPLGRAYFRSTKAHNTLVVDGLDQSEQAGTFLWLKKANSKVLAWEVKPTGGTLVAEQDGYLRLPNKVTHQRQLKLERKLLEIRDKLQGWGSHDLEWRLHFSPICTVYLESNICFVSWAQGCLKLYLDSQMQWNIVKGAREAGWFSSGFNLREPIYTLIGSTSKQVPVSLVNRLEVA
ncbi:MAG: alginate lyase family protein [Xenococcaceae cyanobacterium MO_188.B29]|nr:alginate lyase family protein [Xenococcaceae cyanobacterium MO_188.B29]